MDYQPHELSLAFPDMAPDQYRRLVEDIRAHGLIHPIVLYEGAILDGRHRYRACADSGVAARFEEFSGVDPVAHVTSENAARRHLTESQIAYAVAAMKPYEERKARERQGRRSDLAATSSPTGDEVETPGKTVAKLAEKSGVGARTITRAITVREKGTEELNAKVAAGEIKLNEAEKIARLKPETQRRVVSMDDRRARMKVVTETNNRSTAALRRNARSASATAEKLLPGTEFVRATLGRLEHLASALVPDGKDRDAFVTQFVDEFDWSEPLLLSQLQRCMKVLEALTYLTTVIGPKVRAA